MQPEDPRSIAARKHLAKPGEPWNDFIQRLADEVAAGKLDHETARYARIHQRQKDRDERRGVPAA